MKKKLKDLGIIVLVLGIVVFVFGFVAYQTVDLIIQWRLYVQLREEGIETTGQVLALEEHDLHRGTDYCEVTYAYQPDTFIVRRNTIHVSDDFCHIFSKGSETTVLFLPNDNTQSTIAWGSYLETQIFLLTFFYSIMGLLIIVAIIASLISRGYIAKPVEDIHQVIVKAEPGSVFSDTVLYSGFGLMCGLVGLALIVVMIERGFDQIWIANIISLFTCLLFLGIGVICAYAVLTLDRYYVFGENKIEIRQWARKRVVYPAGLTSIKTISTLPNQPHKTSYNIILQFDDDQRTAIKPRWNKEQTLKLADKLHAFYRLNKL